MADSVRVVDSEWDDIHDKINRKVKAISTELNEFKNILTDLSSNGFIEGDGHNAIISFNDTITKINSYMENTYKSYSDAVKGFLHDVSSDDHLD